MNIFYLLKTWIYNDITNKPRKKKYNTKNIIKREKYKRKEMMKNRNKKIELTKKYKLNKNNSKQARKH